MKRERGAGRAAGVSHRREEKWSWSVGEGSDISQRCRMPETVVHMTRELPTSPSSSQVISLPSSTPCPTSSCPSSPTPPPASAQPLHATPSVSSRLRDSAAKMLKFWPSTPAADLTPRAGPNGQERQNPFDLAIANSFQQGHQQYQQHQHQQASQSPALVPSSSSAAAPPYQHQLLHTPTHLLSPSISAPANGTDLAPQHLASAPLTPGGSSFNPSALPTTSLSLHAPVFNMQQPPPPKRSTAPSTPATSSPSPSVSSSTNGVSTPTSTVSSASASSASMSSSGPSKGQIHVKLIQARGLNVRSSNARPYVVVQFEQNEFVSREPTDETDKEVKGVATPSRNSSSTALSALGAINNKATSRAGSAKGTPSSSFSTSKPLANGVFGSRISAHNPVWKHEVSL